MYGEKSSPHNIAFVALVNTDIAGSVAMISWLLISWMHEKKPTW